MKGIYLAGGYPSREGFVEAAHAVAEAGFDFLEVGIPYNDPVADGPVIASALDGAVKNGITPESVMEDVAGLSFPSCDIYVMTYANIVLQSRHGIFSGVRGNGVKGLILADCPNRMASFFSRRGTALPIVPFVTPETREEDMEPLRETRSPFIYLVGLRGITGTKADLRSPDILRQVDRIREVTEKKIVLGFGIRTAADAGTAMEIADGFVAGTEAVRRQDDIPELKRYLAELAGV